MYWLRKLTLAKMDSEDMESHLKKMASCFKHLSLVVSNDNPLTLEDIYSSALITSLPADWLPCILALMNKEQVAPLHIISAIKQESLRRKSLQEDDSPSISASKATAGDENKTCLHFTFCKRDGHNLEHCFTAGRILADHTSCRRDGKKPQSSTKQTSSSKPKRSEKAGKTSIVQVGGNYLSGGDNSNDSGS
jgi:hypothetical protein